MVRWLQGRCGAASHGAGAAPFLRPTRVNFVMTTGFRLGAMLRGNMTACAHRFISAESHAKGVMATPGGIGRGVAQRRSVLATHGHLTVEREFQNYGYYMCTSTVMTSCSIAASKVTFSLTGRSHDVALTTSSRLVFRPQKTSCLEYSENC